MNHVMNLLYGSNEIYQLSLRKRVEEKNVESCHESAYSSNEI